MTKEELYQEIKESHPEWSEEQIWTQVSIRLSGERIISTQPNMNANENVIIKAIIEAAERWLYENLPHIWEKVKDWFVYILNKIIDWFKELGWSFINNIFSADC